MNASKVSAIFFCASALAGVAPFASAQTAAPASVKPGLWETTATIENAAAGSKRSIVGRTCVAAADASNVARIVPAQHEFGMQCDNGDVKREGGSVVWTISCKSADTTQTGKGKISLFGDSYLGTAQVDLHKKGSKPVRLTQSFSGKWLQACS